MSPSKYWLSLLLSAVAVGGCGGAGGTNGGAELARPPSAPSAPELQRVGATPKPKREQDPAPVDSATPPDPVAPSVQIPKPAASPVAELLVAFKDPEPKVRATALTQLKAKREQFAQEFPDFIKGDVKTRSAAIELAGEVDLRSVAAQVGLALNDPEPPVRRAAIVALAKLEPHSAIQRALVALGDTNSSVACAAIGILARARSEGAREPLLKKLTESAAIDFRPGEAAIVEDQMYLVGSSAWQCEPAASAALALARMGAKHADLWRRIVASDEVNTRRRLVLALSFEDAPPTVGVLRLALDDADPWVRNVAVLSLGRLKDKVARSKLQTLSETDPDPKVQQSARRALASY